jgi:hypothetical protein
MNDSRSQTHAYEPVTRRLTIGNYRLYVMPGANEISALTCTGVRDDEVAPTRSGNDAIFLRHEIIVVLSEDDMTDHRIERWIQSSRRPRRTHALFGSGTRQNW